MTPPARLIAWICAATIASVGSTIADDYKLEKLTAAAPESVAEAISSTLEKQGLRVVGPDGKPLVDLWLSKSLPTGEPKTDPGVDYGQIIEGSLLGVARYHKETPDFRGDSFPAGVYTIRFVLQPADGDHLGVSDTRDFVLLCRVEDDTDPTPLRPKRVTRMSTNVTGQEHPPSLYIVKLFDEAKDIPRLIEDEDRDYWILDFKIPDRAEGKKPVRLSLVVVGQAEEY